MRVLAIDARDYPLVRESVYPLMERVAAITKGRYGADDIERFSLDGTLRMWGVYDKAMVGFATSEILCYPKKKVLGVPFLAGDRMPEWIGQLHERLEQEARALGCEAIEGWGLRAWTKFLPGWKVQNAVLVKEF